MRYPLNENWIFTENCSPAFLNGEGGGLSVELPHSCAMTPYDYFDESCYQMLCGYRRHITVPASWRGKRVFLTVGAAAHYAEVFVNGEKLCEHSCGYTAFTTELTQALTPGKDSVLAISVDSRETLDQPPFGLVVDYMTYGGLYREVWLDVCGETHIEDVFACPCLPEELPLLGSSTRQETQKVLARELRVEGTVSGTVTLNGPLEGTILRLRVLDRSGTILAEHSLPVSRAVQDFRFSVPEVGLWDTESPRCYRLETALLCGDDELDCSETVLGFRRAVWKADGFYLNGRKLKLRGLNRHQSYPYVGYAMPASMQSLDADILKNELGCNAVRTSHYPQSQHFIDRCDETGLLVFTEIPGWQHIGGTEWKEIAIQNVREMVRQYRNHPSVILWGVRINESPDDDELYAATNEAAHALDPTRATGGVRCIKKSSFLEDVYTYNDFLHDGSSAGCERKKAVSPDMGRAYLISEYGGHMFPTKTFDSEAHRTEHMLRHAAVLDAVAAQGDIAGSFGWCMFDYNTHRDFGSGDRICYHGVTDMFRNPKAAAALYAAQDLREPVLYVTSSMDLGEQPASVRGRVFVITNADEVRLYRNDRFIRSFTHRDSAFSHLPCPPIEIDDFIGDQLMEGEAFTTKQAEMVKDLLNWSARFGSSHLPPRMSAKAAVLMARYGMKPADAVRLYEKYIGGWGSESTSFRFEAVRQGSVVLSVRHGPVKSLQLIVRQDPAVLRIGDTYDVGLLRVSIADQDGNVLPYWHGDVKVTINGPLSVIGPERSTLRGGMGGLYLKTAGESGEADVTLETEQTEPVTLHYNIVDEREGRA